MTEKQAIHCMKFNCEEAACEECDLYGTVGTDHCFEDACREAIKALEKQIPKVPCYSGDGYYNGEIVIDTWECPCCGKQYEVDYDDYKYCPNCGQCIDHSTLTEDD